MEQLVAFQSAEGGSVLVEVREQAAGPVTRGLRGATVPERAERTFEEAVRHVQPAVEAVVAQFRSVTQAVDEIHVEFGLNLHAEAGAFIAAASTTANFSVALTWHRSAHNPTTE
ncbi:CU044_2847 family protein [Streptomyces sp. NPDC086766]|uniref:CU044_2847 family protein n=1 Tax=Streptomyces sp. NPDC086766 TaxID=3365754 RepID=UPI0037F6D4EF